jgi:hypothetical protein
MILSTVSIHVWKSQTRVIFRKAGFISQPGEFLLLIVTTAWAPSSPLGHRCIFKKSQKAHLQDIIESNSWEDIVNVYWVIKMSFQDKHTNWNTYLFENS